MRKEDDMEKLLARLTVPEPSPYLAERIIANATAQPSPARAEKQRKRFWTNIVLPLWQGAGMAWGASAAAIAVTVAMAFTILQDIGEGRYTVAGIGLLEDIEVAEEPEITLDYAMMDALDER